MHENEELLEETRYKQRLIGKLQLQREIDQHQIECSRVESERRKIDLKQEQIRADKLQIILDRQVKKVNKLQEKNQRLKEKSIEAQIREKAELQHKKKLEDSTRKCEKQLRKEIKLRDSLKSKIKTAEKRGDSDIAKLQQQLKSQDKRLHKILNNKKKDMRKIKKQGQIIEKAEKKSRIVRQTASKIAGKYLETVSINRLLSEEIKASDNEQEQMIIELAQLRGEIELQQEKNKKSQLSATLAERDYNEHITRLKEQNEEQYNILQDEIESQKSELEKKSHKLTINN